MKRKALIIALMIALVAAMSMPLSVEAAKKAPKKIKLSKTKVTMYAGDKCTLKVKVTPSKANKKVTWKSSSKKIASVSKKGVVKAKKRGKAVINCISKANKKIKAKCRITVKKVVKPSKITLNEKSILLSIGYSFTLKATVSPANTSFKDVKWKSSNTGIVKVDNNGKCTGVAGGKAVVTCYSEKYPSINAQCDVEVMKDHNSSDDEGLLNKATNILSRTCEPLHLILQGEDPSSKSSAQGLTWSVNRNFNGTVKSVEAFVDGVNLSQTYCIYNSPALTLAGSSDSAMDVRSNLMDGTYNFNSDPDEAIIGWSMWNKDSTKADIEKMFNCKISDDVYKKLIEFSQSWVVNRAGGSVVVIYGKNDNGVLTARYAGSVTWNMADNAAVYSFIGVASDNKDAYGKSFSGNAIYK